MQIIHELVKTKTVVLISHRLANSVAADTIYFMENGRIMEKGSHRELLALNGGYCALYKNQAQLECYGGIAGANGNGAGLNGCNAEGSEK